jgi:pimeloyl-ACP methyl ester carboxylesterase
MAEALSTSLVLMPGIGHLPMVEDPAATARVVADHLERAEAAA